MSPKAIGRAVSLLLAAQTLTLQTASAGESPPKGLAYLADPSCPDQSAFAELVASAPLRPMSRQSISEGRGAGGPPADGGSVRRHPPNPQEGRLELRARGTRRILQRGGPSDRFHSCACSDGARRHLLDHPPPSRMRRARTMRPRLPRAERATVGAGAWELRSVLGAGLHRAGR